MRAQGSTLRTSERENWQEIAANTRAEPMHRHMALVRLKSSNAKAFHDKCLQILHDAA